MMRYFYGKLKQKIELGQQISALPLIKPDQSKSGLTVKNMLKRADNTPFSNYKINEYVDGVNCTWTQAFARQALQWEDRLDSVRKAVDFRSC